MGFERATLMEGDAVTDVEGPHIASIVDRPVGGQNAYEFIGLFAVEPDQTFINVVLDRGTSGFVGPGRIEGFGLADCGNYIGIGIHHLRTHGLFSGGLFSRLFSRLFGRSGGLLSGFFNRSGGLFRSCRGCAGSQDHASDDQQAKR